ncbi:MAG TPA: hypothetical protein VH857_04660 [Actinomycetes bacterium]|jgi:hypothetical protein|nr:hypothetical protein [Actinomycetes bacterium]
MSGLVGSYGERHGRTFGGWLVLLALGYAIFQHEGELLRGLGNVSSVADGSTRWADWVDLLTPYVVTGAVGGALRAGGASRGVWTLYWFAAILYTQGHGIHLAGNSVDNALPGNPQPAYLWDEEAGHWLWFVGFYLLVVALALALADRRMRGGPLAYVLSLLVGFTSFTNSVEGQTPWLGIGAGVVFAVWGVLTRDGLGRLLLTAYGFSLVLFAIFGIWQGGFPEFSQLGWI